jgi:hypothetical protein
MSAPRTQAQDAATPKELEALVWLVKRPDFYSSALAGLYEERWRATLEGEGRTAHLNPSRRGAWRRTSGAVMSRLERKGLIVCTKHTSYSLRFSLSDAGRSAVARSAEPQGREAVSADDLAEACG